MDEPASEASLPAGEAPAAETLLPPHLVPVRAALRGLGAGMVLTAAMFVFMLVTGDSAVRSLSRAGFAVLLLLTASSVFTGGYALAEELARRLRRRWRLPALVLLCCGVPLIVAGLFAWIDGIGRGGPRGGYDRLWRLLSDALAAPGKTFLWVSVFVAPLIGLAWVRLREPPFPRAVAVTILLLGGLASLGCVALLPSTTIRWFVIPYWIGLPAVLALGLHLGATRIEAPVFRRYGWGSDPEPEREIPDKG